MWGDGGCGAGKGEWEEGVQGCVSRFESPLCVISASVLAKIRSIVANIRKTELSIKTKLLFY